MNKIKWWFKKLLRSIIYAKFAWTNEDWDCCYLYSLIAFKLKRLQHDMLSSHAVYEKDELNALEELIQLCNKLATFDYTESYLEAHNLKWGAIPNLVLVPCPNNPKLFQSLPQKRANVITEEDIIKEQEEFLECWNRGELDNEKDIDSISRILKQYGHKWWN